MSYITYECTTCRRTKSFAKDNQRVVPNQCVITKGCQGRLLPTGETLELISTPAMAGVTDWYPRGEHQIQSQQVAKSVDMTLSNSSAGAIVVAIKNVNGILPTQLSMDVEQKRIGDVGFSQFTFKIASQNTFAISGKDSMGKNLRFDQLAIAEDRVLVRLNGVEIVVDLSPGMITFGSILPVGSVVEVIVFSEKSSVQKTIILTRNHSLIPSLTRGGWSNIDYVTRLEEDGTTSKWFLYSTDNIGELTSGKIRIAATDFVDALFLLSSPPYQSTDRYLNFVVLQDTLSEDFNILPVDGHFTVDARLKVEIFPPLNLPLDTYITADLYTVDSSSAVRTDTELVRFASSKILGPV